MRGVGIRESPESRVGGNGRRRGEEIGAKEREDGLVCFVSTSHCEISGALNKVSCFIYMTLFKVVKVLQCLATDPQ